MSGSKTLINSKSKQASGGVLTAKGNWVGTFVLELHRSNQLPVSSTCFDHVAVAAFANDFTIKLVICFNRVFTCSMSAAKNGHTPTLGGWLYYNAYVVDHR